MKEAEITKEIWKLRDETSELTIEIDHEREVYVISFDGARNEPLIDAAEEFVNDLMLNFTLQYNNSQLK